MNLLRDTKQLLRKNEYEVYGRVTGSGCSFYYPARHEEPFMHKSRVDYILDDGGLDFTVWIDSDTPALQTRQIIPCPNYARKVCLIMHTMYQCRIIHFNVGLIDFIVDDQIVDEPTFLTAIPSETEENIEMMEKEHRLKGIMTQACTAGMTDNYLILAAQLGIQDGFEIARKVFLGEWKHE